MGTSRRLAGPAGVILGTVCALLIATQARASDSRAYTEEFHHSYPLSSGGRVELENINGAVHITAWDREEVKVDAVKYAGTQERLNEARIEVNASSSTVSIRTEYPDHDHTFNRDDRNNPASVEYTLMVPRAARLDEVKLVNGALDVNGVEGEVRAETINGRLTARGLSGETRLSTINSHLQADFARLPRGEVELSSVNGSLEVTLPSDAQASIKASTLHGGIHSDFGLNAVGHHWVGQEMRGELGNGGTRIRLSNVNGSIDIQHANDGKALSPARSENRDDDRDDNDDDPI
jgi:DUF4097 and DUF4098 domain-containing protein YvlB